MKGSKCEESFFGNNDGLNELYKKDKTVKKNKEFN